MWWRWRGTAGGRAVGRGPRGDGGERRGRGAPGRPPRARLRRVDRLRLARERRRSRPSGAWSCSARSCARMRRAWATPVEAEVVRAMMLLRARSLAMGCSGARPVVAEAMLALLNAGITPVVPEYGSLGASGDLAPLAHCALVLLGEGEVIGPAATLPPRRSRRRRAAHARAEGGARADQRHRRDARDAAARHPRPAARCCGWRTSRRRVSVEALLGTDRAFAEDLVALRPQAGQAASAANLRSVLAGSPIVASHRYGDDRVQDAYSLRCAPQVNGAARDTLAHAERVARGRAGLRDRQPDGAARRPRRVVRQLPRRAARVRAATSSPSRSPRSAGSPSAAPTGCSTRAARTGCRRS